MMKSYREWQNDHKIDQYIAEAIVEALNSGTGRNMQRMGQMLGKQSDSWWQSIPGVGLASKAMKGLQSKLQGGTFSQGWKKGPALNLAGMATDGATANAGEDFSNSMDAIAGEFNAASDDEKEAVATKMWNLLQTTRDANPLRKAIQEADRIKQTQNQGPINPQEAVIIIEVLMNCTKTGVVDYADLEDLWRSFTGIGSDESKRQDFKKELQSALQNNIHTPVHLLAKFFKFGGSGVFVQPHNYNQIRVESGRVLQKYYPDQFQKLMGGMAVAPNNQGWNTNTTTGDANQGTTTGDANQGTGTGDANQDLISKITSGQLDPDKMDANQKAQMAPILQSLLQKMTAQPTQPAAPQPAAPQPAAPQPPTPTKT